MAKLPSRVKNISGNVYGKLTVIEFAGINNHKAYWLCECECGNRKTFPYGNLKYNNTSSCGCGHYEKTITHGMTNSRLYSIWRNAYSRCNNPNAKHYERYGGRGITFHQEWKENFESFYNWAIENGYEDGLTLERINNNEGYNPNNCKWATRTEQQANRYNTKTTEINGVSRTLSEWAKVSGHKYKTIQRRYQSGDRGERLIRPLETQYIRKSD